MKNEKLKVLYTANEKRHWVRLNRRCNQACLFCLDKDAQNGTDIPLEEVIKSLGVGIKRGIKRVVLSGGEATVHPNFLEIIKISKKLGYKHIQVITNGLKLSDRYFFSEAINAGLDEVTFSIHGHRAIIHDKLVGVKGAFVKVLKALQNCKQYPALIVSIDVCINKINIKHLPEIVGNFIKSGFFEFDLLYIVPFGEAWDNRDLLLFDMKKELKYLHKALKFSRDPRVHLWTNRLQAQYLEGYENLIQSPEKIKDEVNGRGELFDALIAEKKELPCKGDRCQFCFLNKFCLDLDRLIKEKVLFSESIPKCIIIDNQKELRKITFKDIFSESKTSFGNYVDFFLKERYNVKKISCSNCRYFKKCSGVAIKVVIEKSFKVLNIID